MGRQTPESWRAKSKEALAARAQIPSVHPQRMISFYRYADDSLVVLCQYSKTEALHLKEERQAWLKEHLGLTQHPEKTQIARLLQALSLSGLGPARLKDRVP